MFLKSLRPAFFILLALIQQGAVFAQTDVIGQVKETIKAGSAKELAKFLNQTVDVSLDGAPQAYSKAQAEFIFRDFFKQNPPDEFRIIHQGTSKGGQTFGIGQYKTGGATYRVYMKIKGVNDQPLVHEISFAKE
jgi:hypothetical protein